MQVCLRSVTHYLDLQESMASDERQPQGLHRVYLNPELCIQLLSDRQMAASLEPGQRHGHPRQACATDASPCVPAAGMSEASVVR